MESRKRMGENNIQGQTACEMAEISQRKDTETLTGGVEAVSYGFVFMCLSLHLSRLDIFPDWVGYLLFREAIDKLKGYEPDLLLLKPLTTVLAVYDAACWLAELSGFHVTFMAVEAVAAVVGLYFNYQFMTDLGNLAVRCGSSRGTWFYWLRILQAAVTTVIMLAGMAVLKRGGFLAMWFSGLVGAVSMVSGICVLLAVHALHRALKEV